LQTQDSLRLLHRAALLLLLLLLTAGSSIPLRSYLDCNHETRSCMVCALASSRGCAEETAQQAHGQETLESTANLGGVEQQPDPAFRPNNVSCITVLALARDRLQQQQPGAGVSLSVATCSCCQGLNGGLRQHLNYSRLTDAYSSICFTDFAA
jgi:hypothetical protein